MSPRLLVLILCLVNLVAGTAVGIVLDRTVLKDEHRGPGRGRPDMARMLEKKLDLDADQAKRVREIYASRRASFEAAMKETQPRMEALRAASDAEIRAILKPEQQVKFDELRREWQQRHADRDRHDRGAPVGSDANTQEPVSNHQNLTTQPKEGAR